MSKRIIPYEFVSDLLFPLEVRVKAMFGLFAVYINEKIVLILRQQEKDPEQNGVWVATSPEDHQRLQKDIPSLLSLSAGPRGHLGSGWLMISENADDFEAAVTKVCEYIKKGDPRIGKIPNVSKRK